VPGEPAAPPLVGRGHVHDGELVEQDHPGELRGVVAVGLALDPPPPPRLAAGVGDADVGAEGGGDVVRPAGAAAGLEGDDGA
jgi:hypothetical protein